MINKDKVIELLETIDDPEMGVDIWTMGLIYDINIKDEKSVNITMTYTSPMCPLGEQLQNDIRSTLKQSGVENIEIEVTFDPPWKPPDKLREAMGV